MEQPSSQSPWAQTMIPLDVSITRQADASLNAPFIRIWQAFLSGRVLLATALVLLQALSTQLQATASPLVWLVCLGYLTLTVVMRWAAARNLPAPTAGLQWLPVIGVDIAAVFLLQILQSSNLNYMALLA
ncbi:MAG: PAS domain-containing sensor histidine kinase, partial [Comamonas sp.]